jgi:hypothetical protein
VRAHNPVDRTLSRLPAPTRDVGALRVRTVTKDDIIEVWIYRGERPVHRQASLSKDLVADAKRYGEHLLANARNDALRCIERSRRP